MLPPDVKRELRRQLKIKKALWQAEADRAGYARARAEFDWMLQRFAALKRLNGSTELFLKAWEESKHPRDHGKFSSSPGGQSDSETGSPANHEEKARSLASRIAEVPAAVRRKVTQFVQAKYDKLAERYGRAGATAVLGAAIMLTPVPLPGTTLIPVALAEAVLAITKLARGKAMPAISDDDVQREARSLLSELSGAVDDSPTEGDGEEPEADPAPYGYCPECRMPGVVAERCLNGNVHCVNGHAYPRNSAKYASTQIELVGDARDTLMSLAQQISDDDLAEDGREDDPHVTVRYGLHADGPDSVARVLSQFGPVAISLNGIDAFRGDESGKDYDVIFANVESPDLLRMNAALKVLPHTDTHSEYHPHATIAYVKAGLAGKYLDSLGGINADAVIDTVTFSTAARKQTEISLTEPGQDNSAIAEAMLAYAEECAADGTDPTEGLERLRAKADPAIEKAYDESKHPRDDNGRFVSKDAIHEAKSDSAKAEELRKRVTGPAQRAKLDAALSGESDLGRTKRGERKEAAAVRRRTREEARQETNELISKFSDANAKPGTVQISNGDLVAMAQHLPEMTVAELRRARVAMRGHFGGVRKREQMVAALVEHARGLRTEERQNKPGKKLATSETLYNIVRQRGGINPDDPALKATYANIAEAREMGISLGVFKKGGAGVDALAEELHSDGYINVPDNVHAAEHLLNELARGAMSRHADLTKQYERAINEHYRTIEEERGDLEQSEVEEALRLGEEDGIAEDSAGQVGEVRGGPGDASEEGLTDDADTSFDVAGMEEAKPAASSPSPEAESDPLDMSNLHEVEPDPTAPTAPVGRWENAPRRAARAAQVAASVRRGGQADSPTGEPAAGKPKREVIEKEAIRKRVWN